MDFRFTLSVISTPILNDSVNPFIEMSTEQLGQMGRASTRKAGNEFEKDFVIQCYLRKISKGGVLQKSHPPIGAKLFHRLTPLNDRISKSSTCY
jgi:hypothetical protein